MTTTRLASVETIGIFVPINLQRRNTTMNFEQELYYILNALCTVACFSCEQISVWDTFLGLYRQCCLIEIL